MNRIVAMTLSVILVLVVAAPMAYGKPGKDLNKEELAAAWWSYALSDPSPLDGEYVDGEQCEGEFVDGVFFLAGAASADPEPVERTCTVPDNMPIMFPVMNIICSEAWPTDPKPYKENCATPYTDQTIDGGSTWYAEVDGKALTSKSIERIASGPFSWTIESDDNPYGLEAGTYEAATDGLWVLLDKGLKKGTHEIEFGGEFVDTPLGDFGTPITYKLTAN